MPDAETSIRLAAFRWLEEQVLRQGEVLARPVLVKGFEFDGERVPLVSAQQGTFKPRVMRRPLSLTTTARSPYNETVGADGLLHYRYRGTNPMHCDNVGAREVMRRKEPLVYFHGVVAGRYLAFSPVFLVDDDPAALTFRVAVDDLARVTEVPLSATAPTTGDAEGADAVRACRTWRCVPINIVEVRRDILEEEDGPMLRHGLKGVHGQRIVLRRRAEWRPDRERLEQRYEAFRSAQVP